MVKKTILLHSCCAPCTAYVYHLLSIDNDVAAFFYNPNIAPHEEYQLRLNEMERLSQLEKFRLHVGDYDQKEWTDRVRPYISMGEGSPRCWECYRFRLEGAFRMARALKRDAVATTLSISPHKDVARINDIGRELAVRFSIEFLEGDFKKNNGYRKSVELSKGYGFYRQNYCGCIYSKGEREKTGRVKKSISITP